MGGWKVNHNAFGHTCGGLSEPGECDINNRFGVGQGVFDDHLLWPCDSAGFFFFWVVDLNLSDDLVAGGVTEVPAVDKGGEPNAALGAALLNVGLTQVGVRPGWVVGQICVNKVIEIDLRQGLIGK